MIYKIYLKSKNLFLLNRFTDLIKQLFNLVGIPIIYKMPVKIQRFTVLRSPHVNKKAREQFEIRTYSRVIQLMTNNKNLMSTLVRAVIFKLPHSILLKCIVNIPNKVLGK